MSASVVYLFLFFSRGDGGIREYRTPYPTYQDCFAALSHQQRNVPNGAENEVAVVAYCGTRLDEHYEDGWRAIK